MRPLPYETPPSPQDCVLDYLPTLHYISAFAAFSGAALLSMRLFYEVLDVGTIAPDPKAELLAATGAGFLFSLAPITVFSAIMISSRQYRRLSIATAVLNCLFFPIGTVLALYALSILSSPAVKAAYAAARRTE